MSLLGISTTKRPGRDTSWVRRAPLVPIGFLVTWHTMVWPCFSSCSMRASRPRPVTRPRVGLDCRPRAAAHVAFEVLLVVAHVAPVQHGVLGRADVDEGRLHAGQHVLHPPEVDVAVDLVDVVGRAGDVVLDQRPALEHGDLGRLGLRRARPSGSGRPGGPCAPGPGGAPGSRRRSRPARRRSPPPAGGVALRPRPPRRRRRRPASESGPVGCGVRPAPVPAGPGRPGSVTRAGPASRTRQRRPGGPDRRGRVRCAGDGEPGDGRRRGGCHRSWA